jgi:hypothetical protein
MTTGTRRVIQFAAALVVFAGLIVLFPRLLAYVEMAAREIRYLWWVILLVALGLWLIFGWGKRR